MKKCTLVLMIIFTIVACKKGEVNSPAVKTNKDKIAAKCDSLTLDDYNKLPDLNKKVEWLKKHGDSVCRKILDSTVLEDHKVKGTLSDQKDKYSISWGNLKKIIKNHGYDAYLSVEHSKEKIDTLKMVYEYISYEGGLHYRFSTALIKSLAKKYAKDDNAEFQFSFAMLDESKQPVVVIQVIGNPSIGNSADGNPYYDYSTDPKIAPTDNIPL